MELIFVTRAVACCSPAGGHSWPSFFLYFFNFFLFTAYTTSPVLIGRPDATLSKATGCAVYQLTSAYRTKEQMSGWWASASSPSEFFFKKEKKKKNNCTAAGRSHTSWKGTTVLLEVLAVLSHGEDIWAETRFTRSRRSEGLGSRRPQRSAISAHRSTYSETSAVVIDDQEKRPPPFSFFAGIWKRCLCKISPVPNRKAPRRTVHTCKFGLKRTAGSLCAPGSDRLGEAPCRSVCC